MTKEIQKEFEISAQSMESAGTPTSTVELKNPLEERIEALEKQVAEILKKLK